MARWRSKEQTLSLSVSGRSAEVLRQVPGSERRSRSAAQAAACLTRRRNREKVLCVSIDDLGAGTAHYSLLTTHLTKGAMPLMRMLARGTVYLLVYGLALTMLFPFVWMVSTSLKPEGEVFAWPPRLLP